MAIMGQLADGGTSVWAKWGGMGWVYVGTTDSGFDIMG